MENWKYPSVAGDTKQHTVVAFISVKYSPGNQIIAGTLPQNSLLPSVHFFTLLNNTHSDVEA
jgi:hypothetical protein